MKKIYFLSIFFLIISFQAILLSAKDDVMPDFASLSQACAPTIHKDTMAALVSVESSFNPYAIGVVKGRLSRQPRNITEALSVVKDLEGQGMNYSLGLSQVNKHNLKKYNLDVATAFDPCTNLIAGSTILSECYNRARSNGLDDQSAVQAALSCYYSGNFTTGFKHGYVQAVVARAGKKDTEQPIRIIRNGNATTLKRNGRTVTNNIPMKEARREHDPAFVF